MFLNLDPAFRAFRSAIQFEIPGNFPSDFL